MHIPDGFLNNKVALGLLAGALGMLGYCFGRVFRALNVLVGSIAGNNGVHTIGGIGFPKNAGKYFQRLAIVSIWIFAAQMFNMPIATSTSAHLIGGVFAAVLMGPFGGFIAISSVLIVQAVFFADGGIIALGANMFNMAFIGSFAAYYIYKVLVQKNYLLAITSACFFSILGAAFACLIEISFLGSLSFSNAYKDMLNLHLLVAVLETVLTLALLKIFKGLEG